MTHVGLSMPTTIRMRLKTMAKLFLVSIVMLAGSPALAMQIARHNVHSGFCKQTTGACRHGAFGISPEIGAPHWNRGDKTQGDWPANLIME
jgi:hypothetical protein